ncbi:uncharacterized protein Z518_10610 [Rhinocladiella mackenziei CBS 650.93]|uniref:DUF7587 domain-containing protein n=1 Tax=Rhinocladiella mackenziei CBS 650.93 TaxID=1442369 RepID=A0A0D2IUS7_9EURO|nr:uncharacterized protein Z518_10610 [Rhinocladiella mackenziei CBS 650.93]KIX00470.1 hypothetical protein Z518_10610 [Rhinocladiella mackenziei CBS 650.93]
MTLNVHSPKHVWRDDDKILLALLYKFYEISSQDLAKIFNTLITDRLVHEGFNDGLTSTALMAQIRDLKRSRRGAEFQRIQSMTMNSARTSYRLYRDSIEDTAYNLRIILNLRVPPPEEVTPAKRLSPTPTALHESEDEVESPRKRRRVRQILKARTSSGPIRRSKYFQKLSTPASPSSASSYSDSDSSGSWCTAANSDRTEFQTPDEHFPESSARIPPLLRINFDNEKRSAARRPRLLFRAFDAKHGFKARRFLDSSVAAPPEPESQEFSDEVLPHLTTDRRHLSPFLSWTENPERALKLLVKNSETPRCLAIFDYNVMERELENRHGKWAGPWAVPPICRHFGFDVLPKVSDNSHSNQVDKTHSYTGTGEFLSWGCVESEPVAIIDYATAHQLWGMMRYMKKTTGIGFTSGKSLAKCLHGVREVYKEVVAYKLLRSFKISGYEKGPHGIEYENFIEGVYGTDPWSEIRASTKKWQSKLTNPEAERETSDEDCKDAPRNHSKLQLKSNLDQIRKFTFTDPPRQNNGIIVEIQNPAKLKKNFPNEKSIQPLNINDKTRDPCTGIGGKISPQFKLTMEPQPAKLKESNVNPAIPTSTWSKKPNETPVSGKEDLNDDEPIIIATTTRRHERTRTRAMPTIRSPSVSETVVINESRWR